MFKLYLYRDKTLRNLTYLNIVLLNNVNDEYLSINEASGILTCV